jgi:hypothetical protein
LAAADAHGFQPIALIAPLKFAQQIGQDTPTRCPNRVAERNARSIDVQLQSVSALLCADKLLVRANMCFASGGLRCIRAAPRVMLRCLNDPALWPGIPAITKGNYPYARDFPEWTRAPFVCVGKDACKIERRY